MVNISQLLNMRGKMKLVLIFLILLGCDSPKVACSYETGYNNCEVE